MFDGRKEVIPDPARPQRSAVRTPLIARFRGPQQVVKRPSLIGFWPWWVGAAIDLELVDGERDARQSASRRFLGTVHRPETAPILVRDC